MENLNNLIFLASLFFTLVITRLWARLGHDFSAYTNKGWKGKEHDKSKTLTGVIRRKTGKDIHHFHLGFILVFLTTIVSFIQHLENTKIILFAVSFSLIADQAYPILKKNKNYFNTPSIIISIILHIIIGVLFLILV